MNKDHEEKYPKTRTGFHSAPKRVNTLMLYMDFLHLYAVKYKRIDKEVSIPKYLLYSVDTL